jgi:hypothetical protein
MMLDELFRMIDRLTPEEKQQVRRYIDHQPDMIQGEIDAILSAAQPVPLKAGTMDVALLLRATDAMWAGMDEDEIDALVQAMNEEYIEPDRAADE